MKMGAHAIYNAFRGPIGEEKEAFRMNQLTAQIAMLRLRLGAVTAKAQGLSHTVDTYKVRRAQDSHRAAALQRANATRRAILSDLFLFRATTRCQTGSAAWRRCWRRRRRKWK